jgi:hypothetical protein
MTLGLTTYVELSCSCGEGWEAEACKDLGALDFVYEEDTLCPSCGAEGVQA